MTTDRPAQFFCYFVLMIQVGLCGWFVQSQSTPLPVIDEWDQLETYFQPDAGNTPWVWQHHGDHRYPLTRWVWIESLKLTGFRFHGPQFLTLAFMTSAAVLSLWVARMRRGTQSIGDVVFPALLLHFGHGITWTMGYQLGFAIVVNAFLGWLWTAAHYERSGRRGWLLLNLLYLLLILPCGGFGIAMTPAMLLWLLWLARRDGAVRVGAILCAVGFCTYTVWIVRTTPPVPEGFGATPWKEPVRFIRCFAEFLACSFGTWSQVPEAYDSAHAKLVLAVPLGLLITSILLIFRAGWGSFRVAVLTLVFGIVLCAAAAAYRRPGAFLDRYIVFGAVAWIALGLGYLRSGLWRQRQVMIVALLATVALFVMNIRPGLYEAYRLREGTPEITKAINNGRSPEVVSAQHVGLFAVQRYPGFSRSLGLLRDAGIEPFRKLGPNTNLQLVPFDLPPLKTLASIIDLPIPPDGAIGLQARCTSTDGAMNASVDLWMNEKIHEVAYAPYGPGECQLLWMLPLDRQRVRLKPSHPALNVTLDQWMWIVPTQPTN